MISVRFAVAVDSGRIATFFRALEAAGVRVELTAEELVGPEPRWPVVLFGPLPRGSAELQRESPKRVIAGEVLIDLEARLAFRGTQPIDLGSREFDLLAVLAQRADQVVSREALLAQVWDGDAVCRNTVEVHVSALRRKLDDGGRTLIDTVRGQGYLLRTRRPADRRLEALLAQRQQLLQQREAEVARREAILLARRADEERRAARERQRREDQVAGNGKAAVSRPNPEFRV
jgi:DNA-binding winged helix-turn-helix (wHTH) protein